MDKVTGAPKVYPDGTPKQRIIRPSFNKLKQIQKSIKINILDKVKLLENIQGGVKKKSNITNAKKHQGKKYLFATDLQDFFHTLHISRYTIYTFLWAIRIISPIGSQADFY